MSEKRSSFLEEQQAYLRAKTEALIGKRLRLEGLLPPQRLGDPEPGKETSIPLWPLFLLLPLLLLIFWPKERPSSPPPPLNISVQPLSFPSEVAIFYQANLLAEAELCQNLLEALGCKVNLQPLSPPYGKGDGLYLIDGPSAKKLQELNLLAPLPLSVPGQLPIPARVFPAVWGSLATEKEAYALPFSVSTSFLFADKKGLQQVGLSENHLPQTWGEVLELLPRLERRGEEALFPVFWPFEESPLFWAYQLDSTLGAASLKTAAVWLGQLLYRQGLSTLMYSRSRPPLMLVARSSKGLEEYYRALPPTPQSAPSPSLAQISYLAVPKGSSLAQKLPQAYMNFVWDFPEDLLPPLIDQVPPDLSGALLRASPLFLEPKKQQELNLYIYQELETIGKESRSAGN